MTEAEILQGLKNGDERSFRTLVDQYQSKVKATCMGILHNPADADDVAQEVFIEVFRSVGQFRENARLSSWIYRIAVNKSLNLLRSRKRSRFFSSFTDLFSPKDAPAEASSSAGNSDIESQQRTDILHKAINDLPENQRIAFILNKYDDLSYKEIAEVMETTLPGVESLIYRAKTNLQKKLERCWKNNCL